MQGSSIRMMGEPKGIFMEGVVAPGQAPFPGMVAMIMPYIAGPISPVALSGGDFVWGIYGSSGFGGSTGFGGTGGPAFTVPSATVAGDPRIIAVFLEDQLQGFSFQSAYVATGSTSATTYVPGTTRCFLYIPANGEFLNMLVLSGGGTGQANQFTIGERLQILVTAPNTGMLGGSSLVGNAPIGTTLASPFTCMENINLPTPGVQAGWVWCMRTYQN
jgi:hypothetical protein